MYGHLFKYEEIWKTFISKSKLWFYDPLTSYIVDIVVIVAWKYRGILEVSLNFSIDIKFWREWNCYAEWAVRELRYFMHCFLVLGCYLYFFWASSGRIPVSNRYLRHFSWIGNSFDMMWERSPPKRFIFKIIEEVAFHDCFILYLTKSGKLLFIQVRLIFHFLYTLKTSKNSGFLTVLGVLEMKHSPKMG